jgi:hypothetical protein
MSSFVRFSTPTFAAFAWAALNLASGSDLAVLVRVFVFTAVQRGEERDISELACGGASDPT